MFPTYGTIFGVPQNYFMLWLKVLETEGLKSSDWLLHLGDFHEPTALTMCFKKINYE